jgi:hypothetical protein
MLVQSYAFPTSKEMMEIERTKLPKLTANSPVFRYFPFDSTDSHLLEWTQEDNWGGMAQIRGLNGMPPRVASVGEKSFIAKPGVYGEHMPIDEMEMTIRAARGDRSRPARIDDLVMKRQDQLLDRRLTRIEWLCWQLMLYGRFIVHDINNQILHRAAYSIQEYTAPIAWSNLSTAKPLQDLRNISLLSRGQSTAFDQRASLLINRVTANNMLSNTNPDDLGGKLWAGLSPVTSMGGLNSILTAEGLPNVEVYDEGYLDQDTLANTLWIPDNVGVVAGARSNNAPIGRFRFTLNVNNPGSAATPYVRVLDHFDRRIPRLIEVHDGFNGGPVIFYPGSIVRVNL